MAMQKRKISATETGKKSASKKTRGRLKKILYVEIDDEVTFIYEKLQKLRFKNVYLVSGNKGLP